MATENRARGLAATEFELIDTGVFDEDRYFDVFAEYAKGDENDMLIRLTVANRGPEKATLHLLPTLWFRNTWSWGQVPEECTTQTVDRTGGRRRRRARITMCWAIIELCYEGRRRRRSSLKTKPIPSGFTTPPTARVTSKDAFHECVIHGRTEAVNPANVGHQVRAAHYVLDIGAGRIASR